MTEREQRIHTQQLMVAEMQAKGWHSPGGRDPATRQPLTLGEMYDRYETALCVIDEKGAWG